MDDARAIAKAKRVLSSIVLVHASTEVSECTWMQAGDRQDDLRHGLLGDVAQHIGFQILKANLAHITETIGDGETRPPSRRFTATVEVINPTLDDTTRTEIAAARQDGMLEAMAIVRRAAEQFRRLDMYGPVQALALDGVADQIKAAAHTPNSKKPPPASA